MSAGSITDAARSTPLWGEFEVVVLGGGPAGITAAPASGRAGDAWKLIPRQMEEAEAKGLFHALPRKLGAP